MESLPQEITEQILLPLSVDDILSYCQANPKANEMCKSRSFWLSKLNHDFGSNGVYPSDFVDPTYEDGLALYRLFSDSIKLGLSLTILRGYVNVADWLLKRRESGYTEMTSIRQVRSGDEPSLIVNGIFGEDEIINSEIYETMNLQTQMREIEWLLSHGIIPFDGTIVIEVINQNVRFIELLLKYNVNLHLPQSITIYFTINSGEYGPTYTDTLLDIDMFELLIKNGIFADSYLAYVLRPKYLNILKKYGVSPYDGIQYIDSIYNDLELLEQLLENGVFPTVEDILMTINAYDSRVIKRLMLISKFVPIVESADFRVLILNQSLERGLLDVIEWYAQQGYVPDVQGIDDFLMRFVDNGGMGISYPSLEWLLQHGIFPSMHVVDQISAIEYVTFDVDGEDYNRDEKGHVLTILAEYGVYPRT